jgi:molecular chaperone GrpE
MSDPDAGPEDLLNMFAAFDATRMFEAQQQAHRQETSAILLGFLDILDALDRIVAEPAPPAQASVALLQQQLVDAFARAGVSFVAGVGAPFDPTCHEAVELTGGQPPDTVAEVLRRGCWFNGALLRPARVVVTTP